MKVLCCQLRNYGDIIRTFPFIDEMKRQFSVIIGFVCFDDMVETVRINKNIDHVIAIKRIWPYQNDEGGTRIVNCTPLSDGIKEIKELEFDVYIDFHGVFQSGLIGLLSDIKQRVGKSADRSKDGVHLFYTEQIKNFREILNKYDLHYSLVKGVFPSFRMEKRYYISKNIQKEVVLIPGSSKIGYLKRWPIEKYIELITALRLYECKVKIVLGPEELDLLNNIGSEINSSPFPISIIHNMVEFDKEIADTDLIIGNDTSFLHFGVYRKVPILMILGPTSSAVNCAPSFAVGDHIDTDTWCRNDCDVWSGKCAEGLLCMQNIQCKNVLEKAIKLLGLKEEYAY